jgi:hypothetical protein
MCTGAELTALFTAAATTYGVTEAQKSAKRARQESREASAEANRIADAARIDANKMAEQARIDAINQSQTELDLMRETSGKELKELQDKAAVEAADRQRQLDAYNVMVKTQQEQAVVAREALTAETARFQEQKAEAEKQAASIQAQIDEQRREAGEKAASQTRARRRGGIRALLSDARLNPEVGLPAANDGKVTTLGGV